MTSKRLITLTIAALAVFGSAAPAHALPPRYDTESSSDYFLVECGKTHSVAVASIFAKRPKPVRGPRVGQTIYSRAGDPAATVVSVERSRTQFGEIGVRWTIEGDQAACDPEHEGDLIRTESFRFSIRWRIPRSTIVGCGSTSLIYTRAYVGANSYVSTCRKARSVASTWARYWTDRQGVTPYPVTIGGYRCGQIEGYRHPSVTCRKARARIIFEWGD